MNPVTKSAAVLLLWGSAVLLRAQTPIQPGQLAAAPKLAAPLPEDAAANAMGVMPRVSIATSEDRHDRFMNRLWVASIFADIAGTSLDAGTSWRKREGNSLLASSDGTFGARGLSIKAAFAAVVIVPQICLRKHKELKGIFVIGNFGEAAIFAGTAVHNLQVSSPPTAP